MELQGSLPHSQVPANCPCPEPYQSISPGPRLCLWIFRNKIPFDNDELLAPRPTPKLEDHPLSAVRDCLFNIFAATLHIGGRFSIRNLRTRHAVVTGTHLSRGTNVFTLQFFHSFLDFYFSTLDHHPLSDALLCLTASSCKMILL